MSNNMSGQSPQKLSGSPTRRGTTSDKERKSSPQDGKSTDKPVKLHESDVPYKNSNENMERHSKTSAGQDVKRGSVQEQQKKPTGIWCDSSDPPKKENENFAGGHQISDCSPMGAYYTPDPRMGYLQAQPGIYPMAPGSNFFPPTMNFPPPSMFPQKTRSNERFAVDQPGANMTNQSACNPGWKEEFLPLNANYPNAPQQFQMLPRSANLRPKNNRNNQIHANYVPPRLVYSGPIEKPSPNYPQHMQNTSQQPGIYNSSHNYYQDPGYGMKSTRKDEKPVMHQYGKKEMERQQGYKQPGRYYGDPREAMNCKKPMPIADDYRFNYQEGRDPRFGGNNQNLPCGSSKYDPHSNDTRYTGSARSDVIRYPSPPERKKDREIGYQPMQYHALDPHRYQHPSGYPARAENRPYWQTQVESIFPNQDRMEQWPPTGSAGGPRMPMKHDQSVPQNVNLTRPLLDLQRNLPGAYMENRGEEALAKHDQPYYDPSYQITRVRSNEQFNYTGSCGQKRPMPQYNQHMMIPPMFQNFPPPYYQALPPEQMPQQTVPDCYGVSLDELDSAEPASHLRRCAEFQEIAPNFNSFPENCDKKNNSNN